MGRAICRSRGVVNPRTKRHPPFIPDRGEVVWVSLDPTPGHEQAGHRLALVLSPAVYNARAGLMLACPVTRQVKGYPFEVRVPADTPLQGVFLADQVRSLDWAARRARPMLAADGETLIVSESVLAQVQGRLQRLLFDQVT